MTERTIRTAPTTQCGAQIPKRCNSVVPARALHAFGMRVYYQTNELFKHAGYVFTLVEFQSVLPIANRR